MKKFRVIKATDDKKIWHTELEPFVGEILGEADLAFNPLICDKGWLIIKTGDYDPYDDYVMPILIHKSCLEELTMCSCSYHQVINGGCICGGY